MDLMSLLYVIVGTLLGFIAGFIPGIGNVVVMLIAFPFLGTADLYQLLIFYMAMASASHFSGSIVATTLGIPGDISSLPAVKEGHKLFINGNGNFAISSTAIGGILGSIISILVVYSVMPFALFLVKNFYNNLLQVLILSTASLLIIFLINRYYVINFILFSFGILLSTIGFNETPKFVFASDIIPYQTFPSLYQGLPFFPVLVALFVIPKMIKSLNDYKEFQTNNNILYKDTSKLIDHLNVFWKHKYSALRGSFFGGLVSLIPHVHTALSSNLSYSLEKSRRIKRKEYKNQGDIGSLVAAETANNTTSVISMLPLLIIGIPIATSEAILLLIIEQNFYTVNYTTVIESGLFNHIILWFLLSTVLCFIFSWPIISYVNYFRKISLRTLFTISIIFIIVLMIYIGYRDMNHWYTIVVFLLLIPIGILLRNYDTMPLVIGFVLQNKLFESYATFVALNF